MSRGLGDVYKRQGKKERGEPYLRSTLDKVVVFIILAAAVASIVLVVTGQVVL